MIHDRIHRVAANSNADVVITEIGTVGDIESAYLKPSVNSAMWANEWCTSPCCPSSAHLVTENQANPTPR